MLCSEVAIQAARRHDEIDVMYTLVKDSLTTELPTWLHSTMLRPREAARAVAELRRGHVESKFTAGSCRGRRLACRWRRRTGRSRSRSRSGCVCWGTSQALVLFTDALDKLAVEIDGCRSRDELDPAVSAFCDAVVSLVDFDCLQHFVIGEGTFRQS